MRARKTLFKFRNMAAVTLFVSILLSILLVACRQEQGSWERIQESGVIRVGLDPTYPPFELFDGTTVKGIDVDLAQALSDDLGLQVEFTYFGYDGLYDALATGQVDLLASALVIAPEKLRDFAYTASYFNAGQVLVSPAEEPVDDQESIEVGKLAVELGAQGHVEALKWQRRAPDMVILPFESVQEALNAVTRSEADAALVDHIGALTFTGNNHARLHTSEPVTDEPYAFVVTAREKELLRKLNDSLNRLSSKNQIQPVLDRWFNQ